MKCEILIMLIVGLAIWVYFGSQLETRSRAWLTESRERRAAIQILWDEVNLMNEEVLDLARARTLDIQLGSVESTYEDLGTASIRASVTQAVSRQG